MMLLDCPMVVVSRDGVVFGPLRCVEAEFGDDVVDLVVSGVPAIDVESWAWLTHPTVHPVAVSLGDDLWVQMRSSQSVWCCRGVVIGLNQAGVFAQLPRFFLSVALAADVDRVGIVSSAGNLVGVLWPGG